MKKVLLFAVTAIMSITAFTACEEDAVETTGEFTFTALHKDNGEPIQGVTVAIAETLGGLTDLDDLVNEGPTGLDGKVTFGDLKPGNYHFGYAYEIGNVSYFATDGTFEITSGKTFSQKMSFDIQVGNFNLIIIDSNGNEIPGIKVKLASLKSNLDDEGEYYELTTDEDGEVLFENFWEGTYYYYYYYEDGNYYWENTVSVNIEADETYTLELTLN